MKIKELYKRIVFYASVPKCVSCRERLDIDDRALCKSCKDEYEEIKSSKTCSVCFKCLDECKCTNTYLEKHMMHKLVKVFRYKPSESVNERIPSNQLIYVVKRVKRRDLLDFISDEMITSIKNSIKYENYVITNVPRKRNRVMKYGLDHSAEIAKCISRKLGVEYVKLLKSKSKKAQKKTHGEERLKNAKFDYVRKPDDVEGKRVILVDDIVTTGASMGASAMLIRALGAKEVVGASLAITFRDVYRPFEETVY